MSRLAATTGAAPDENSAPRRSLFLTLLDGTGRLCMRKGARLMFRNVQQTHVGQMHHIMKRCRQSSTNAPPPHPQNFLSAEKTSFSEIIFWFGVNPNFLKWGGEFLGCVLNYSPLAYTPSLLILAGHMLLETSNDI